MRCQGCHYCLEKLTEPRCPECGRAFDPDDPSTFDVPGRRRTRWIRLLIVGGLIYLLLFLLHVADIPAQPTPQTIYNAAGVQIQMTNGPEPIWPLIALAALHALMTWPYFAFIAFIGSICLSEMIRYITAAYRFVRSAKTR